MQVLFEGLVTVRAHSCEIDGRVPEGVQFGELAQVGGQVLGGIAGATHAVWGVGAGGAGGHAVWGWCKCCLKDG